MTDFITNVVACDYLTVGTFNPAAHSDVNNTIASCDIVPQEKHRMQYDGMEQTFSDGSVFWGTGIQKGVPHYLTQVSGAASDRFIRRAVLLGRDDFNVTRLDIQLTIRKPDWFKARAFLDTLRTGDWAGRRKKATMVDNYGDDTVYIGSWHSDSFARVYVKEKEWIRFENEWKKERADSAFRIIKAHGPQKAMHGLLYGELLKLPDHPVKTAYREVLDGYETMTAMVVKPESKRMKWFIKQCTPAIQTLLSDHDCGDRTREILEDLLSGRYLNG